MKAFIDLEELGAVIASAPETAIAVSKSVRKREYETWGERMTARAVEADNVLYNLLTDEVPEEERLSPREKMQAAQYYIAQHPENGRRPGDRGMPNGGMVFNFDLGALGLAARAADECKQLGPVIEVKAEEQ